MFALGVLGVGARSSRPVALALGLIAAAAHGAPAPPPPETNVFPEPAAPLALGSAQWNGWGRDVENTRYQPEPALRATDIPRLALKWAYGLQGSVVAGQPTVVDGRLFALSATGRVYSLDAKSGCTYWTFDAAAGTRTAISIGELGTPRNAVAPPAQKQKPRKGHSSKKSKQQFTNAHL
jgi:glucose dehydrogenase